MRVGRDRWNHNIHYGLEVLNRLPRSAKIGLDVGCGEGWLVRELSHRVDHVVGLDPDRASIDLARDEGMGNGMSYVIGDLLSAPFSPSSFDVITCVAALHHTDEEAGMHQLADLLRPGGTLAIIGLARSRLPLDMHWEIAGAITTRILRLTRREWHTPAPKIWPPPHSYDEIRDLASSVLPGAEVKRRVLYRYVLTWTKPRGGNIGR